MTRNEIILGLVVLVLIVYSLVVALVVPRRNPSFPGKSLGLFLGVTAILVAGTLAAVQVVGGEEAEEAEAAEVEQEATTPAPAGSKPEPPADREGGEEQPPGDSAAGALVWEEESCGGCHTLADAGSSGTIGPNLDESKPSFDLAVDRVTNGKGPMPSFAGQLTEQQIGDVAAFVVSIRS